MSSSMRDSKIVMQSLASKCCLAVQFICNSAIARKKAETTYIAMLMLHCGYILSNKSILCIRSIYHLTPTAVSCYLEARLLAIT